MIKSQAEALIAGSKGRALVGELNDRREATAYKIDMYNFDQMEYTQKEIGRRYPTTYKDLLNYTATVPLTESMVHQLAKLFKEAPIISPDTKNTTLISRLEDIRDRANLEATLQTVDRMVELTGMVGVVPIWNRIKQQVQLDIILQDRCIVFTHEEYPDTPMAVAYRINSQGDDPRARVSDIYYMWTSDSLSKVRFTTNWEVDSEWDIEPNPYGRIPIVWFSNDVSLDGFWSGKIINPIVEQNILTNIQLTSLDIAFDYQAFATLVTRGWEENEIKVGVTRYINMPNPSYEPKANADAFYINPNTDLRQVWEIINGRIEFLANLIGVGSQAFKDGAAYNSGYQLKLSKMGVIEHNQGKVRSYTRELRELMNLIGECENAYGLTRIPKDINYRVDFAEMTVETNPKEDMEITEMKVKLGLQSRIDALMHIYPDMTRKDAEAKIKQIDKDNTEHPLSRSEG